MKLSMIVCAFNEAKSIGPLLGNLMSQAVPPEVDDREIIVVTSGCSDGTERVVEERARLNPRIRLISEPLRSGKAAALNRAFEASSGGYVALIPADVSPAENALLSLLLPFRDSEVSAVSGRPMQDPRRRSTGFCGYLAGMTSRLWAKLMSKLNDQGEMGHCSGELMAIRSDVKAVLPGECAADDSFLAIAARRRGHVKFAPDAVCFNLMPSNVVDYVNQRRRWLYGHFQTRRLTGEYPTVLDTVVFSRPSLALRVLAEEVVERPGDAGCLAFAVVVEGLIFCLSLFDLAMRRRYGVWPVIRSTKFG